jgi:hypothetical protein
MVAREDRNAGTILLPSLLPIREIGQALCARATSRASAGDFDGFLQDVLAAKRLARKVGAGTTPVERLVGTAMDAEANDPVGAIAGAGLLSEQQCGLLETRRADGPPLPHIAEGRDMAERWIYLNRLVLVATGKFDLAAEDAFVGLDLNQDAILELGKELASLDRSEVRWDIAFKQYNSLMDQVLLDQKAPTLQELRKRAHDLEAQVAQWKNPNLETGLAKRPGESPEDYSNRIGHRIIAVFSDTTLWKTEEIERRSVLRDQMTSIVLAAAQVKARTGKWPEKLADLVPAHLREIPHDLYPADAPGDLQYFVTPDGISIRSAGDLTPIIVGVHQK